MTACAVLAIPLTVAGLIGFARAGERPELAYCAAPVGLFVLAVLWLYARVPIYGIAKATYMLGTTPCLAVLVVAGLAPLTIRGTSRSR